MGEESREAPEQRAWGLAFPEASRGGPCGPRRKQTCSFQIEACKHTPGGCLFFPEEVFLSPHAANSLSQPPIPFLEAVIPELGAVGSSPTLTGKGKDSSIHLLYPLCSGGEL